MIGAPRDAHLMDAYHRALSVLRRPMPGAEIIDVSGAEGLVDRIESDLRAHDHAVRIERAGRPGARAVRERCASG
jgi:hypothetical protein